MKSKFIVLILIHLLLFTFCKDKKKKTEPQTPSNSNPVILSGDYGTFLSTYYTSDFGNNVFVNDSTVQATFYDSPLAGHSNILAGTVTVNSTLLTQFSNNIYSKTNQINLKQLNWQISGNGSITATSFSYTPLHPSYTGSFSLPDTVTKSNGFSFNLTGITNNNKPVYITIGQSVAFTKTVTSIPSIVTVTPNDLSGFVINEPFSIRISMFNYSNITVNSVTYGINANRTYEKVCYIK
jgi:hypothetical protein